MVTILLKPQTSGSWSINRCNITLFSDLQLGLAIKLAREMARDEHLRSGRAVRVEMPGPFPSLVLANHTDGSTAAGRERSKHGALAA